MERFDLLIVWYAVLVVSVVSHEAAHALTALRFGDRTAWLNGLATLNPVPHIQRSPVGMVLAPLVSFIAGGWMIGWASVPYDPYWAQDNPRQAAWMALAGPGANLALAIAAGMLIHLGLATGFFYAPETVGIGRVVEASRDGLPAGLAVMVSVMFMLNILLMVFNLIPIAPLDGTALAEFILRGDLRYRYRRLMAHPNMRVFGIFIAWFIISRIYFPIYMVALNLLYLPHGVRYG